MQAASTYSTLPKHELPMFGGQQADWESFKSRFCSKVKNIEKITPVEKLEHLVSYLEWEQALSKG